MSDDTREAEGRHHRAQRGGRPAQPSGTEQPSDAGFEDYDLTPGDDTWRLLEDIAARTPGDRGWPVSADKRH